MRPATRVPPALEAALAEHDPPTAALSVGRTLALEGAKERRSGDSADAGAGIDLIDLFSGCGGLSAGFRLYANRVPAYRLAAALDIDTDANATYLRNLGHAPFAADAHAVASSGLLWRRFLRRADRRAGNLTVVAGGPPCQGFSSHRKTLAGCEALNVLLPDFARLAVRLAPAAVLLENVPELVTDRSWPYHAEATDVLRGAGYVVRTRICNFAGFGLPQERFRVLTLALRRPFAMPEPFLTRPEYRTVRQAIGHLPPAAPGRPNAVDPDHARPGHRPGTLATIAAVPRDGGRRPPDAGPDCLRRLAQRNGKAGYDDVYGRLWWDRPAVTITSYARNPASGRFLHPEQDRGLTVREAALLQGFPAEYRFSGGFDSRFIQAGNAVPPTVAAYLAGHLLAELLTERNSSPGVEADIIKPVGASFSRLIAGIKRGAIRV
jgi:DNA (cytosine-5)-methyltransferase 1